jgi:hypothetical protein
MNKLVFTWTQTGWIWVRITCLTWATCLHVESCLPIRSTWVYPRFLAEFVSFDDLRILITHVVSSNSSYIELWWLNEYAVYKWLMFNVMWAITWKTIKYHTVETVIKSNRKSLKEAKSIPLTHRYMIAYLPDVKHPTKRVGLVQNRQHYHFLIETKAVSSLHDIDKSISIRGIIGPI